jgi:type IV pilus assembly protein PilA
MARREDGFTIMELLVVFLILAVLTGLALPTILGQKDKGWDGAAKSDARNLVSQVESCFVHTEDYRECNNTDLDASGLPLADTDGATPAKAEVSVEDTPSRREFTIAARSKTDAIFRISRDPGGYTRSCAPDGPLCKAGGW